MEVCKECNAALLLGKGVEGVSDIVMEEVVGECVIYWIGKWIADNDLLYGELMTDFGPLPSPSVNSWTQHCTVIIFPQ